MKGYELQNAMDREFLKRGAAGSPVRCLTESGYTYDIVAIEDEEQPDGSHILWLKLGED